MTYIIFRYLHLIAIVVFAGALVIENMAIARTINSEDARNLAKVDGVLGLSAIVVLALGLSLWLWVGKPAEFYSNNILFQFKLALFGLMAVISVRPTLFLFKHRNSTEQTISVPGSVIWLIRIELIILLLLPVFAVLMARGIGLNVQGQ
jgi:putative membrane protein